MEVTNTPYQDRLDAVEKRLRNVEQTLKSVRDDLSWLINDLAYEELEPEPGVDEYEGERYE